MSSFVAITDLHLGQTGEDRFGQYSILSGKAGAAGQIARQNLREELEKWVGLAGEVPELDRRVPPRFRPIRHSQAQKPFKLGPR